MVSGAAAQAWAPEGQREQDGAVRVGDDGVDIVSGGGVGTSPPCGATSPDAPAAPAASLASPGVAFAAVSPEADHGRSPTPHPVGGEHSTRLVELDIPARADYVALVRQVVVASARTGSRLGEERLENLRLAVSEACTNAIHAHSAIGSEAQIHIRCHLSDDRIEVEVVDQGHGFDPAHVPAIPAVGDPNRLYYETGLGIPLMQLFTDRAEIRSSSSGTNVRLVVLAMPVVGG